MDENSEKYVSISLWEIIGTVQALDCTIDPQCLSIYRSPIVQSCHELWKQFCQVEGESSGHRV
jgi:hypothetical protein